MISSPALLADHLPWKRLAFWAGVVGLGLGLTLVAQLQRELFYTFPEAWNLHLRDPIDQFQAWVIGNRNTHPIFFLFFDPLSDFIDWGLRAVEGGLLALPWYVIVAAFGLFGFWLGRWRLLALTLGGLLFCGLVGLWDESMQTLALMTVSVLISLLIGIPLGILAARSDRFDAVLRPALDALQTMPAFVYLVPVLLFFGVGRVPGVVATVIFAVAPAIRLTNAGIRQVPPPAIEAARSFGSTPRQMLYKVQLPLALPSIMTGVNQTIMMALGIVVIAALIGAGGLGREVTVSLQRLQVGRAFEAGLAIVFLAIILDRLSDAFSKVDFTGVTGQAGAPAGAWAALGWPAMALARLVEIAMRAVGRGPGAAGRRARLLQHSYLINSLLLLGGLWLLDTLVVRSTSFPAAWLIPLKIPVDAAVAWMRDNLFKFAEIRLGGQATLALGTGPLSDFMTIYILNPVRDLFSTWLPWPVVILIMAALAQAAAGWRLAVLTALGMFGLGLLSMWELSMDTLSQILVAIMLTALLAFPLGVLSSRSDRVQALMRPVLDTLQTIPPFVYLVPVIMLFNIGRIPGLIASVLYALPPGIKLVDLGIRQVSAEALEAAKAFGSTPPQTLVKVELPLAMPSILIGLNQIIMMVLSMVVISGMVGGAGLGLEAVTGLARNQTGRGIESGLAIVILAIIIDRITQGMTAEKQ